MVIVIIVVADHILAFGQIAMIVAIATVVFVVFVESKNGWSGHKDQEHQKEGVEELHVLIER